MLWLYLFIALMLLLVDMFWINFVAMSLYSKNITGVQKRPLRVDMVAAIIAYMFTISALLFIAIPLVKCYANPKSDILLVATIIGGFVGFIVYGIFNFTCKAFMSDYMWSVVAIDTLWGTVLFASMCFLYYFILQKIKR